MKLNRDQAFFTVVQDIKRVIQEIRLDFDTSHPSKHVSSHPSRQKRLGRSEKAFSSARQDALTPQEDTKREQDSTNITSLRKPTYENVFTEHSPSSHPQQLSLFGESSVFTNQHYHAPKTETSRNYEALRRKAQGSLASSHQKRL